MKRFGRSDAVFPRWCSDLRALARAGIYTDGRAGLTEALGLRDGTQLGAIDETMELQ